MPCESKFIPIHFQEGKKIPLQNLLTFQHLPVSFAFWESNPTNESPIFQCKSSSILGEKPLGSQ